MKAKIAIVAALLVVALAAAWLWFAAEPAPRTESSRPNTLRMTKAELPATVRKDRVMLDEAQVEQALASGTVDRPSSRC